MLCVCSRESFTNLAYKDIPDVSDDDRMEGEEPLLESMAIARRLLGEAAGGEVFPITVTASAGRGILSSGDVRALSSPPSKFGMTLDHYMLQMVTTPASAAATSGVGSWGRPSAAILIGWAVMGKVKFNP